MPESPLVQLETTSLADLEALIATRSKRNRTSSWASKSASTTKKPTYRDDARHLAAKFKIDKEAMEAEYARRAHR